MTLTTLITLALLPVAVVWLLPLFSECVTIAAILHRRTSGAARADREARPRGGRRMRLAFLVPAHDEELLVGDCVRSLLAQRSERAEREIFVIADNCSDATARVASQAGARVLERFSHARRGKPAAIEWALGRLALAAFDAVVIVDADSVVQPGFADALAARAPLREKAVQAYNGLSNEEDTWLSRLGGLLGRVRYEGQYGLKARAGLNCPLTGNGMCLGTALLRRAGWAPDSLTENWELYARYTALGERIDFAQGARVGAREAPTLPESVPQRRRWQAGRWRVLRDHWRPILSSRAIGWRQKLDVLAELSIPGPMLHATLACVFAALLLLLPGAAPSLAAGVAGLFLLSVVPIATWTVAAWLRHPEPLRVAAALARLPVYGVWRIGVACLAFATSRRGIWLRSPRPVPAGESEGGEEAPAA